MIYINVQVYYFVSLWLWGIFIFRRERILVWFFWIRITDISSFAIATFVSHNYLCLSNLCNKYIILGQTSTGDGNERPSPLNYGCEAADVGSPGCQEGRRGPKPHPHTPAGRKSASLTGCCHGHRCLWGSFFVMVWIWWGGLFYIRTYSISLIFCFFGLWLMDSQQTFPQNRVYRRTARI